MKRRIFLKGTLAGSAVALAAGAGLLNPRQVLAAWPKSAFEAKDLSKAMRHRRYRYRRRQYRYRHQGTRHRRERRSCSSQG